MAACLQPMTKYRTAGPSAARPTASAILLPCAAAPCCPGALAAVPLVPVTVVGVWPLQYVAGVPV